MEPKLATVTHLNSMEPTLKPGWLKRVTGLAGGVFFIWVFAVHVTAWLASVSFLEPMYSFIEEKDIKATAYYYTDIEEFSEADLMMRSYMSYPVKPTAHE